MLPWRSCVVLTILVVGCDASPTPPPTCEENPEVDCCEVHPERPECNLTCVQDPTQPECALSCEEDPFQDMCRVACADDPVAPHCEPAPQRPGADVEVIRDSLGLPHVFATTDADAMWASGYMQASDRLFQMDIARRQALGRQAEVLGPDRVADDALMRTVNLAGWTEVALRQLEEGSPTIYALLVAWTAGVNARVDEVNAGDAPLPAGFTEYSYVPERWRIMDGPAVGKLLLFGSSNQIENDLLATILRDYLPEVWSDIPFLMPLEEVFAVPAEDRPSSASSPIVSPEPGTPRELPADTRERLEEMHRRLGGLSGEGSNNWAMHGRYTINGRPMIAGDPHQPLRTPSLFWAHHMHSDEGLDVAGFSFVGAPGVHLGHNRHVVWTATLNYPDMMDLWDVVVGEAGVSVGGEEVRYLTSTETIEVAGEEAVELEVIRVPGYGVILPDDVSPLPVARAGRRLLFNWTGFAPTNDFASFHAFNTAANVGEFEAALNALEIGAFNFIVADSRDIFYGTSLWLPRRDHVTPDRLPWTVMDGDDPDSLWTGVNVARASLPHSRGTTRGYLVTANNDPFGYTADGDSTNDPYYFGVFFDPGTRASRAESELQRLAERAVNDREPVTIADMQALQTDVHSRFADYLIPLLISAWAEVPTNDDLAEYRARPELDTLYTLLTTWDRRFERDQPAPVAFTALLFLFTKFAVEDEFSLAFEALLGASSTYLIKVPLLAATGAYGDGSGIFEDGVARTMMAALSNTASWLEAQYGSVDPAGYRWSDLHCTRLRGFVAVEGLDGGCVPSDGGDGTINVSGANMLRDGRLRDEHQSSGGAIYRMVASFGDDGVPMAEVSFPRGNVEDPASPYFTNNLDDWIEGRYRPLPFVRDDVVADAQETTTLTAE